MSTHPPRIYLSPPHMSGEERQMVEEVFDSNWIAPLGPQVDAFEMEFAGAIGTHHAAALASGTAALHLALILAGVQPADDVAVSTFTFSASVNPIRYLHARPIFIDSEAQSWNMDPVLLEEELDRRSKIGRLPKAVVLVHIYGQPGNVGPILRACDRWSIPLIEDAAEALGATYQGRSPGTFGQAGVFSFNGNKVITTSGGGMLVSRDEALISHARKLASQARDPAPHYEHSEIGYNYRLSNVLAAIGRAQLRALPNRVASRRRNFEYYQSAFADVPGLTLMPEAPWGTHSRWLTCVLIDPAQFGANRATLQRAFDAADIEVRPLWKPMHMQPVFAGFDVVAGTISERLFARGLCLPSGSTMTVADLERVVDVVRQVRNANRRSVGA